MEEESSEESEGRNLRCSACHPRTARIREQHPRGKTKPAAAAAAADDMDRLSERTGDQHDEEKGVGVGVGVEATRKPAASPPAPTASPTRVRQQSAPPAARPRCGPIPLDQVVITYKALRLAISFPPHASVRIRSAGPRGTSKSLGARPRT